MKTNLDILDLLGYYLKSMVGHIFAVIICGIVIPSSEDPSVLVLTATTAVYIVVHLLILFLFFRKDVPFQYRSNQDFMMWLRTAALLVLPGELCRLIFACVPLLGSYFSVATMFTPTPTFGFWLKLFPSVIDDNHIGTLSQIPGRIGCYILIHLIYMAITVTILLMVHRMLWNIQDKKSKNEVRLTMDLNQMK